MRIGEMAFAAMESVRKKCIAFAKDGNTVVKPYKTLYSLENITHNEEHKNLYIELVKREYGDPVYQLWEDLGVICISQGWIQGYWSIEEVSAKIAKFPYLNVNGFYKRLEESESKRYYINKVDIEVCALLGNIDLAKHFAEYREKQIADKEAKRQAEKEERQKKEREEEEQRITEIEKAIQDAEYKIFHQEDFENTEVDRKSIINRLMEKYGINIPLRTKGWINSKLAMIVFNGGEISYRFYGKTQRDNSTVFRDYLVRLETAINEELALPFN
ncbi:hypothetical protein NSB25_27225 [Acetatifactor muris]|uniref:Uncharacterized protein n=1 Tax=Acetatifactor muris TaxID=879566 RepID=A0A2K4ZPV1_9FIRM|nr:hypothetical protein [Acetatifactor muris]MCR2050917.1 hypothetical protein [Acetatifactor muris]SOY32500.1 hypothetical protein AMURIS_05265 [Acetatifactor muris]